MEREEHDRRRRPEQEHEAASNPAPTIYRHASRSGAAPAPMIGGGYLAGGDAGASFREATSGTASAVPFQKEMESSFGADFSGVKAHLGRAEPLDRINANAATSGDQIAFATSSPDKKLVAHELTHVVQQRQGGSGAVQPKSQLSAPGDAAESEADAVAERAAAGERVTVTGTASPAIHRHLKDKKLEVPLGHFEIDFTKTENPAGKSGEDGTLSFHPNDKAPDSKSIRMSQVVKTTDPGTGKDADWSKLGTGSEADRNKMMSADGDATHVTREGETLKQVAKKHYGDPARFAEIFDANKGTLAATMTSADGDKALPGKLSLTVPKATLGGYFVDHMAADARATPRTKKTDAEVPQDYVWAGEEQKDTNQHGSKQGKKIVPASLKDFPGTGGNLTFSFQTVARAEDAGVYFGTVNWSFEVNSGKVSKEAYSVMPGTSDTFRAALDEFNKFYKNPHTVMKGETLWAIAEKYYGDGNKWGDIFKANKDKIKDPDHIEPGWKLNIPIIGP